MYSERQAEIEATAHINIQVQSRAKVEVLIFDKAPTEIPAEYSDYNNVFSAENVVKLPENTGMNKHAIELEESKQQFFGSIYSLGLVELKMLKTYMETNLVSDFIHPSKSPTGASILFNKKPNKSFHLCVDYWGFNNITIKNQYSLSLIGELLDWLGWAKRFTQLDLTNAYHWMRICENNKWKTAFWIQYGHFKYQVMPFGLSNALVTF